MADTADTTGADYTARLQRLEGTPWKRWLGAQAPYRWNVRRLGLGRTLDVGCGIGRNLAHLDGNGVGVDHNAASVRVCRARGLTAYTVDEFGASPHARSASFDSVLAAHLVEHLDPADARRILGSYLPYLKPDGRVVFITPQERGYATDASHVFFAGFGELTELCADLGLTVDRQYSFPFPRAAGRVFAHNEFVVVAHR